MKINPCSLATAIAAIALAVAPVSAQPSLADQKAQADLDKLKLDMEAARLKMQLDQQTSLTASLAAIRGTTGGQASIDKPEATAEGLLLTQKLYARAATRLSEATGAFPAGSTPLVVFGSVAPTTADWMAFRHVVDRLEPNLDIAANGWEAVIRAQNRSRKSSHVKNFAGALGPIAGAATIINAVTSVASFFRVDTVMAGAAATATDNQLNSLLSQALVSRGFQLDRTSYEIPDEPVRVKAQMARLSGAYERAQHLYHREYLPRLAKVKKIEELPPAVALAGKNLETAVNDYETLQRTLHTPAAGLLPATVIERQAVIAENRGRPLIFISGHKAALTSMTRKGFLTTLGSQVPIFLNAAAQFDYVLASEGAVTAGSIVCTAPRTRITAIASVQAHCGPASTGPGDSRQVARRAGSARGGSY